jgi:hypothetical protein
LKAVEQDGIRRGFLALDYASADVLTFLVDRTEGDEASEDSQHLAHLTAYGCARHSQVLESGAPSAIRTLAVGIRRSRARGTRYAFALFQGSPPPLPSEVRHYYADRFGGVDYDSRTWARKEVAELLRAGLSTGPVSFL